MAWGNASDKHITEASGIAASTRNPGVVWTHNDGSGGKLYALATNGALLATFDLTRPVDDVEDIALGPGPGAGAYLYVGDAGGAAASDGLRSEVKILRVPEPLVDLGWEANPRSDNLQGVESFTLRYPDGSYDAETLLLDPWTHDVLVGTKQDAGTRFYRANLDDAMEDATLVLDFVRTVSFDLASGGAIAADGGAILLRREDLAKIWLRCDGEDIKTALGRAGQNVPVIGPPAEPNGEGIDFLPDGTGYLTISDTEAKPPIYFFQAVCPMAPRFTLGLSDESSFVGGTVHFEALAVGYPAPAMQWSFGGAPIPGAQSPSLVLVGLDSSQAGLYTVTASNASGTASSSAFLTVRPKPDLRITEVQSSRTASSGMATGDWWELTSFETQPVDLAGFRFNDGSGGLTDPYVLPDHVMIQPGESVIWVESLNPAEFKAWWGADALPAGLQVITYSGSGLGFASTGDGVRLWAPTTIDPNDTIASVDFGAADAGVTFNYDPATDVFGVPSQLGVNGVFQAAATGDIGSPGRIRGLPPQPVVIGWLSNGMIQIAFDAVAGFRYSLESRSDLTSGTWSPSGTDLVATNNFRASFTRPIGAGMRFYRVVALSVPVDFLEYSRGSPVH